MIFFVWVDLMVMDDPTSIHYNANYVGNDKACCDVWEQDLVYKEKIRMCMNVLGVVNILNWLKELSV